MTAGGVVRRAARPDDAPFLAWAILAASRSHLARGWFDIVLDRREEFCVEFLRRLALTQARSWWHWSRFRVAEVDGEPVAALCAFRGADAYPLSGDAMREAAATFGFSAAEQERMWARGNYVYTCIFEGNDDAWTIENVATLPGRRGLGLAGMLIDDVLAEGRRLGLGVAQITFLIGNEPAAAAYAAAGFTFSGERRSPDFEAATGAPGLCRVVRSLQAASHCPPLS